MRQPLTLTRQELFDQIWARPMTKVASDYGISDVGLKKICDKHRIPVPGRGYWAKLAAGKPVRKALLHRISDPLIEHIFIHGSSELALPAEVREAKRAAMTEEKKPENHIVVAERQEPTTPLAKRTMKSLSKAKPGDQGLLSVSGPDVITVAVGPNSVNRVSALLDALVLAAEARGHRFGGEERCLIMMDGEGVSFSLSEKVRREPHKHTPEEIVRLKAYEEKVERYWRRHKPSWDGPSLGPRPTFPEWDYTPTGTLMLQLAELYYRPGLRRTWTDGVSQRLEDMLNGFLAGAVAYAAAEKAHREEQERRERERREQEERRRRAERWRHRENRRVELAEQFIEAVEEARRLEGYVGQLEARMREEGPADDERLRVFVEWLRGRISRLRDVTSPAKLQSALEERADLFRHDPDID